VVVVHWVLDSLGKHRLRHVYQETTLELTTRRLRENRIAKIIERIVGTISLEVDRPIMTAGSATILASDASCGIEPDTSFYVSSESEARRTFESPRPKVPPPDLVIEVDPYTDCLINRLGVFARAGVREVWRCDRSGEFQFFRLQHRHRYRPIPTSQELPVTAKALDTAIHRMNDVGENSLVRRVVANLTQYEG
jgi:Uma2 family endonuclease